MVKNVKGGSGHKSQARKNVVSSAEKNSHRLRLVEEEGEIYAQVSKDFGNGMCEVICNDNVKRLCIIRGKYRGRGKRDNEIRVRSIIMVGLREWETHFENSKKLEKCDLLEVYSDYDVERLKKSADITWSIFDMDDSANQYATDDIVHFSDNTEDEYKKLVEDDIIKTNTSLTTTKNNGNINDDDNETGENIDFDDI
uniref:S1-like domain-containing protein n=1 Tax=viral metagenome TaxID=1070528 RepID=A0A6C0EH11_9ZZZZ